MSFLCWLHTMALNKKFDGKDVIGIELLVLDCNLCMLLIVHSLMSLFQEKTLFDFDFYKLNIYC